MLPDTATQNHHAPSASSPLSNPSSSPGLFSSARRESPPALTRLAMGQAESTARQPDLGAQGPPLPSPQPTSKFRLAWPGRRKKSEDFTKLMNTRAPSPSPSPSTPPLPPPTSINNTSRGRELARQESNLSSVDGHTPSSSMHMHELSRPPSRTSSAKQLTLQFASNTLSALKGKLNASQASIHSLKHSGGTMISPTTPPPPLPPKPDLSRLSQSSRSSHSENSSGDWISLNRSSKPLPQPTPTPDASAPVTEVETQTRHQEIVPTATAPSSSPEHASTSTSTSTSGNAQMHDVNMPQRRERERREGADAQTAKEIADDWRKSDSTLRTVRLVGSRTPRPLSLAESTNSGHTVLPSVGAPGSAAGNMNMGAGKRLSALMTDVDFGLKEVDSEDDDDDDGSDDVDRSALRSSPPSAYNSVHTFHQQQQTGSPSSSRASLPVSSSSKPQPTPRRGSLSIRIGRLSGSRARADEHGHLSGSDSEALSSSVSTRGTGTSGDTGMFTANSSTTSVNSSLQGASTKDSRPSIEIASSASIASSFNSQHAHYKANAKLEPWISLPAANEAASESQASLSTSESASASASSHMGSPSGYADTERSGKHAGSMSPPRGPTLRPAHQRSRLQSIQARGFRQTAVSLTTGLAPAAGFARKAVDRLGRALGGSSTSVAANNNNAAADAVATAPVPDGSNHGPSASHLSAPIFGMPANATGQNVLQHEHRRHAHAPHPPSSSKKAMRRHGASPSGTWSVNSNSTSDTDGGAAGPNLGRCLRGRLIPANNGKGLVFGRELELCVKDTECADVVENGADGLMLEGRSLPALVVRCAQHIVKWGVQEEGLFRISGRATHVFKLRTEFDSGADYDLRECGPGEIDPHAVASVFKAYLRELPEPLLTRHLTPYFEAALSAENAMLNAADAQNGGSGSQQDGERARRPGLPSGPRDSIQVRKAPSLSTFAVPTLSPRTASQTLLNTFSALIARLPKENRDLLRTVTELIMATARASRETKMPLSNLLLVFCPSVAMSPPLLRVLCEGKGIWDGPLEVEDAKIAPVLGDVPVSDAQGEQSTEKEEATDDKDGENRRGSEESDTGLHHQGTVRRAARTSSENSDSKSKRDEPPAEDGTSVVPPTSLPSLILPSSNEDASTTSAHAKTDSSISAFINLSSPGDLTHSSNSSDSLHTPHSSSSGVSSSNAHASFGPVMKPTLDTTGLTHKIMALRAQSDLPSPLSPSAVKRAVRKSLIGNPVPFPLGMSRSGGGCSAPVTPIELGGSEKLSLTTSHSSSSPNLGREAGASGVCSTPPRLGRRKSKTSLLGLKTKRSLSSLLGIAQAHEHAEVRQLRSAAPDLTVEEQELAHTQPPRSSTPCPVLDLPVDTSRIELGAGLGLSLTDAAQPVTQSGRTADVPSVLRVPSSVPSRSPSPSPSPSPPSGLSPQPRQQGTSMMMDRTESNSSAITNSVFYTPPTTARALAPATWSNSVSSSTSTSSGSGSGSYSFLDFNLGKNGEEEEDWAKSVLRAAASSS